MKKSFILLFLVFLILTIIPVFSEQPSGRLELIKGTVIYQLPGQTTWTALAQKSADIFVGTIIQTKENSQAILKFEDGCKILIGEMTLFKIQSREEKEKKNLFTIKLFGKTFVEVKKNGAWNNFKIQTPTALATIRGSKMLVKVKDDLLTEVLSAEGIINVASAYLYKGTVTYVEGNKITLQTPQGIKTIVMNTDTIIPVRNGSTAISPNDRIAIYGGISEISAEHTATQPATTLPGVMTADLITFTNPSEMHFNTMTTAQQTQWVGQPIYSMPAFIPTVQLPPLTTTIVAPGFDPLPPAPAPASMPVDLGQASTQQSQQAQAAQTSSAGSPTGDQASTSAGDPATPGQTIQQSSTGGTTGVSTSNGKPSTTPPAPVIGAPVNSTTSTGAAQFNIQ